MISSKASDETTTINVSFRIIILIMNYLQKLHKFRNPIHLGLLWDFGFGVNNMKIFSLFNQKWFHNRNVIHIFHIFVNLSLIIKKIYFNKKMFFFEYKLLRLKTNGLVIYFYQHVVLKLPSLEWMSVLKHFYFEWLVASQFLLIFHFYYSINLNQNEILIFKFSINECFDLKILMNC